MFGTKIKYCSITLQNRNKKSHLKPRLNAVAQRKVLAGDILVLAIGISVSVFILPISK